MEPSTATGPIREPSSTGAGAARAGISNLLARGVVAVAFGGNPELLPWAIPAEAAVQSVLAGAGKEARDALTVPAASRLGRILRPFVWLAGKLF